MWSIVLVSSLQNQVSSLNSYESIDSVYGAGSS
jgi:hypothetical protein